MRTRVKICGVRTVEDALLAAAAGADAIGFIQVEGAKRRIAPTLAAEIALALPAYVTPVLVVADQTPDEIRRLADTTGIRTVQLHGHERVDTAIALHGLAVIKRIEVGPNLVKELDHWSLLDRSILSAVLLEGPGGGGTGVPTDWSTLDSLLRHTERATLPPIVVAGGLTPENVADVISRFHPYAVDTSSGVESPAAPLKKDPARLTRFFESVLAADCT